MKPLSLIFAVVCFVIAIAYFAGIVVQHHVKHGVAFLVVGVLCLVWFRFQSASAR